MNRMKRKHHAPTGADYPRKRKQSKTKEITVPSNTRDVPLSTIFVRLLNDITNKNSVSRIQAQVTTSTPTNKRGI